MLMKKQFYKENPTSLWPTTNSFTVVLLKDQTVGQIVLIFNDNGVVFLLVKKFTIESVHQFPAHIKKICTNTTDEFIVVRADEVSEKLLLISTTNENFLSPLPNQYEGD